MSARPAPAASRPTTRLAPTLSSAASTAPSSVRRTVSKVNVEKVRPEDTGALKTTIRNQIRALGVELWPYIFVAKQSELDEDDEE